jgi:hypothetical protein
VVRCYVDHFEKRIALSSSWSNSVNVNRRQFGFGLTASLAGLSASIAADAQAPQEKPSAESNPASAKPHYFFKNPTFEMIF